MRNAEQTMSHGEWCSALDKLVAESVEDAHELHIEKSAWDRTDDYRAVQRTLSNIQNTALALRDALILRERVSILVSDIGFLTYLKDNE